MNKRKYPPLPTFDLSDIYDTRQLHDIVLIARDRVFAAFDHAHATEARTGAVHGTEGFILGAGSRQCELVRFILDRNMKPFVSLATLPSLPPSLVALPGRQGYTMLVKEVHERLLRLAVESLVEEKVIWHDNCVWNILTTALDSYRVEKRALRDVTRSHRRQAA